jgi:hypothetical protein
LKKAEVDHVDYKENENECPADVFHFENEKE